MTKDQLNDIETSVNQAVLANEDVGAETMSFADAVAGGAMAIFGEKYGDEARVLTAGSTSRELCGGCHTDKTGNIGVFKILGEQAIASGIRRIEGVTGPTANAWIQRNLNILDGLSQRLKVPMAEVGARVQQMEKQGKEREKTIDSLKKELQAIAAEKSLSQVKSIGGVDTLILEVDQDVNLKAQAFMLLKHLKAGVILLGQPNNEKISVIVAVTKNMAGQVNAGQIIKDLSPLISARGGGRPDMAQCGGDNPAGWPEFKKQFESTIESVGS